MVLQGGRANVSSAELAAVTHAVQLRVFGGHALCHLVLSELRSFNKTRDNPVLIPDISVISENSKDEAKIAS